MSQPHFDTFITAQYFRAIKNELRPRCMNYAK